MTYVRPLSRPSLSRHARGAPARRRRGGAKMVNGTRGTTTHDAPPAGVKPRLCAARHAEMGESLRDESVCSYIHSAKNDHIKTKNVNGEKANAPYAGLGMVRETHAGECARSVAHTQAHSHAHFVQAANVNMSKSVQVRVQYSLDASGAAERGRSAAGQPEGGGDCRGSSASPSSSTRHSSARLQHAWSSGGRAAWLQVRAGRSARPLWRRASRRG